MKLVGTALALLFLACWFGQGSAQCACNDTACRNTAMQNNPNQQMCCRWVDQVNDMNPNSLNDPNGTPLGFLLDQYRGTDSNLPDLCVQVNFPTPLKNIRYVVVAVETQTELCIRRRNPGPDDEPTCGSGGVFFCHSYTSGFSIDIEFYCGVGQGSCPVNDEVFYLRPNVTLLDTDDEYFCDNINRTLPSSLVQGLPPPNVIVNPSQDPFSGASPLTTCYFLSVLTIVILLLGTLSYHLHLC